MQAHDAANAPTKRQSIADEWSDLQRDVLDSLRDVTRAGGRRAGVGLDKRIQVHRMVLSLRGRNERAG
jgi:hypothetical protein